MINNSELDCVLLHGWGFTSSVWQGFDERLTGYKNIVAPCLYEIANELNSYNVASMASKLDEKYKNNSVVVAWSLGGLVAMEWAAISNNIKAVIFISSAPCFVKKTSWNNVLDVSAIERLLGRLSENPKAALQHFAGLVAHGEVKPKTVNKKLRGSISDEKNSAILSAWLKELLSQDLRIKFSELNMPTQFFVGEHDALIDSQIIKDINQLRPDTDAVIVNDCGHAPFLSCPDKVADLIDGFINE